MTVIVRTILAAALLAVGIGFSATTPPAANAAGCGVIIYEIYYNSPGTDNGANSSLNGEWIQLKNTCTTKHSLAGWYIKDAAGAKYAKFGTFALAGGAKVKIHTGAGANTTTDRYWNHGQYVWNNTGNEAASLRNGAGTLVDKCSYTGATKGYVFC